jgi:Protein of unknown function (DUF2752)
MALALLATGAALSAVWLRLGLPLPYCTLKEWTGLPCATCGTTRMIQAVLSGELVDAFALNPLVFSGLALTIVWGVASAARWAFDLPIQPFTVGPRHRARLGLAAAVAVLLNWIYLLVRGI